MHAARPSNLPVCALEKETPQTLSHGSCAARCHFGQDQQCNFSGAAAGLLAPRAAALRSPSSCSPPPPRSSLFRFSPHSPHPFPPFCLIASAPPYNHAGARLSFGVVYIAVIVRAQCRDWAEHVYSFTGQRRHKSGGGGEKVFGSRRGGVVGAHEPERERAHPLSLARSSAETTQ